MLNVQEKVSIVNELWQEWPLSRLLIVSGLPRSTFYYHVRRLAAPDRYQSARALVLKIYHQHKCRYVFIRAYLRASTEDQFADRAKDMLELFVQERGRLLMDSHRNDILLVEQIDRLTRLSNSDWITLKKQIEQHELRIVSLDVPTSWQALSDKEPSQSDSITRIVITAINNMLIDLMSAMSHKDWLSRRQRQKQGIERAHTLGEYRGKQADQERHQKVLCYRQVKKLSIRETADAMGYSTLQVCRIQALYRESTTD